MDPKARAELGLLLTDQDKLLEVLAKNATALADHPHLQLHLLEKNHNSVAYRKALRDKTFTKQEYQDEILLRLDEIGYAICQSIDLDFLVQRVASRVGADTEKIQQLEITDFGVETLSKLLHLMGNAVHASQELRPGFPWEAIRGQANPKFWQRAHQAYDLYLQGYSSHWKLNQVFKEKYDIAVPQSFIRFAKRFGDPRLVPQWVEYSGWTGAN